MTPMLHMLVEEQLEGRMHSPHEQIPQQSTHAVSLLEQAVAESASTIPES
jgi:hypothetical protein